MKEKNKRKYKSLRPVRLYLEDIYVIDKLFNSSSESYKIDTEDYDLASIDEITNIKEDKIYEIGFQSSNPLIHLDMNKSNVRFYYDIKDIKSLGLLTSVKEFLNTKTPFILRILGYYWQQLIVYTIISIIILVLSAGTVNNSLMFLILWLLFIIWILISTIYDVPKKTIMYLSKRSDNKSFIKKYKDQIILIILSTIIGGVIGGLILNYIQDRIYGGHSGSKTDNTIK